MSSITHDSLVGRVVGVDTHKDFHIAAAKDARGRELEAEAEVDARPAGAQAAWWRLARTITFTALGTALRRGELLGLRWRDVQVLEGHLHVREAVVNGRVTTPKSRASRRLIELGPRTTGLLAVHFARTAFS